MANFPPSVPLATVLGQKNSNTVDIVGDSLTARNWRNLTTGLALSVSGTTCTCTLTAHSMYKGMVFRYVDRGQSGLMGYYTVASYVDANTFTFTVPAGTVASPTVDTTQGSAVMFKERKPDDGFYNYALNILGQRMTLVNNFGVAGDATSHLLLRMSEILASTSSKYNLLIGTNDARNGITIAAYSANLLDIVTQMLKAGKTVDLCTVPPFLGNPPSGTTATCNQLIVGYNAYIRSLCRNDPRLTLHDGYAALVDGTSATAAALTGMIVAADGTHFTPLGAYTYGAVIAANCTSRLSLSTDKVCTMLDSYAVDSTNKQLLANPLMQGTSGGVSGGTTGSVPTNWTVTMASATSCVASIAAKANGVGNDLIGTLVATSTSSRMRFDSESLTSKVVAGHTYFIEADVLIDAASPLGTMAFELQTVTTSGSVAVLYLAVGTVGNGNCPATGTTQTFRSNDFTLPVALSTCTVRLDMFASGSGTIIAKMGQVQLRDVT